jgi:pimeloyl-ACP methyl ester carboxylesterase
MAPRSTLLWTCVTTLVHVLLLPVYIAFFVLFLVVWMFLTFTGIGPALQYFYTLADRQTLSRDRLIAAAPVPSQMRTVTVPAGVHSCSPDKSYRVFAIFAQPPSPPSEGSGGGRPVYPPVCIPNGLGATAALISQMQEHLVAAGFSVLSFDRLGVGLSDPNLSGRSPTAMDVVQEMDFVMRAVLSDTDNDNDAERANQTQWLLLGPSMGSIVAQCYMARFPHKVQGFLNMDGLPYPFFQQKASFQWAALVYRLYACLVWTGVLRPFIGMALQSVRGMFACESFDLSVAVAQMNQSSFYGNVALEMMTMMDCCEMAETAWGPQSVLRLPKQHREVCLFVLLNDLCQISFSHSLSSTDSNSRGAHSEHRLRREDWRSSSDFPAQ